MIVTTRAEIVPLCDKHRTPMILSRFEGGSFGMNAFSCLEPNCTRAYTTSSGYVDVVDGQILLQKEQQLCREDGTAMFLESLAPSGDRTIEIWRCGQKGCNRVVSIQP